MGSNPDLPNRQSKYCFLERKMLLVTLLLHLGIILHRKLTFTKHLRGEISIARKRIQLIQNWSSHADTETLDRMYKLFVIPHL